MDRFVGIFIKRTPSDERFHVERCGSKNMELLKIKIADGSEDPVNVVFEGIELSEVEAVLKREEWGEPVFSNAALLESRLPDLEMQRAVLDEVVRFHIRLFRYGGRVVGNVHLDRVPIERLEGVVKVLMGGRMNPTTRSVRGGCAGLYILRMFLRAPQRETIKLYIWAASNRHER
jgi:hypothetical protein